MVISQVNNTYNIIVINIKAYPITYPFLGYSTTVVTKIANVYKLIPKLKNTTNNILGSVFINT